MDAKHSDAEHSEAEHSHAGHGSDQSGSGHIPAVVTHASHAPGPASAAEHEDHASHGPASAEAHEDHGASQEHSGHPRPEVFLRKFWLTLILTVPVVAFSTMVQDWFGYSLDGVPGHAYIAPILGTFVFLYGGLVFLRGGWQEIRARQPGMMLLISLGIGVAFISSAATEIGLLDLEFWWELAALVTVMLLGHWQEMRALGLTRGALAALAELLPDEAERIEDGEPRRIAVADLRTGDIVLVRPGTRVPADGTVVEGEADFDESMLTGESRPLARGSGDRVAAGTVALGSAVRVRVDAVGDGTALAGIQRLVADAQASNSRTQAIADRAAAALFYIAVGTGLITFLVWSLVGDVDAAVIRTVTVLVISCPHALGLAIPLVISISTEMAARNGILIKDRLALERMRTVDVVLFDKTGTLTEGRPSVTGVWAVDGDEDALLQLAGAVEMDSEHPLALAIVEAARDRGKIPAASAFAARAGRGVRAVVAGATLEVGGPRLLRESGATTDAIVPHEEWSARGATILYLLRDGVLQGALSLEDHIRDESRSAIDGLHAAGVEVAMVTGDAANVAAAVARDLGIDEVFAEVLPENKFEQVEDLQRRGRRVAMVGDGVNDAPALARADVGIAIGAGTDVAIESAGVVLASDDPRGVLAVTRLSRASYRKMIENLAWAVSYNVIALPLAAGVLSFAGFVLPPAVGALLMSLSTVIVALNAQLLRRLVLSPTGDVRDGGINQVVPATPLHSSEVSAERAA